MDQDFALAPEQGFMENKGQVMNQCKEKNDQVEYIWSSGNGMNVQLRVDGIGFDTFHKVENEDGNHDLHVHRLDMHLEGTNRTKRLIPKEPLVGHSNYYPTSGSTHHAQLVETFGKIIYTNIYDQIDLAVGMTPDGKQVKYDFILNPGADISDIKITYRGFSGFEFLDGELHFDLSGKTLVEKIPLSWTLPNNKEVEVTYTVEQTEASAISVGFSTHARTSMSQEESLVIDPLVALQWSTYYGDSLYDVANSIATDSLGNIFIAGTTESFHTMASEGSYQSVFSGGQYDAFLVKFNQHGLRHWSTYYGGSGEDHGLGVAVDAYQYVYMVGRTTSADSIGSEDAYQDSLHGATAGFLAKFDRLGTLKWDTYIGGENFDEAVAVAVNSTNQVYVAGNTLSPAMFDSSGIAPDLLHQGATDGFISSFDENGALVWATFLGGENDDFLTGIALDSIGQVYVSGTTNSTSNLATPGSFQPAHAGLTDAFAAKLSATGQVIWASYYGWMGNEHSAGIATANEQIYITGHTDFDNSLPTDSAHQITFGGIEDGFVAALDGDGAIAWYTYFGGEEMDRATGISTDYDGNIYIAGNTRSTTDILQNDSSGAALAGETDAFVARFNPDGGMEWSQYFGTTGDDEAMSIAAYGYTAIFIAGKTVSTESISAANGEEDYAHQEIFGGGEADGFAARFTQFKSTPAVNICGGECPWGSSNGSGSPPPIGVCIGDSIELAISGGSLGIGSNWVWYRDSCGVTDLYIGDGNSIWVSPAVPTSYFVRSEHVDDYGPCRSITVYVDFPPSAEASVQDSICPGTSTTLNAEGGLYYTWTGPDDFESAVQNPIIDSLHAANEGIYTVVVETMFGCRDTAIVELILSPAPMFSVNFTDVSCPGFNDGSIEVVSEDPSPLEYIWIGLSTDTTAIFDLPAGEYQLAVTNVYNCTRSETIEITEPLHPLDSAVTKPAYCDQANGEIFLFLSGNTGPYSIFWSPGSSTSTSLQNATPGTYYVEIVDANGCMYTDSVSIENIGFFDAIIAQDSIYLDIGETVGIEVFAVPEQPGLTYLWTPPAGLSCADCPNPVLNPNQTTLYSVTITSIFGCTATDSIYVHRQVPPSQAFIPTIFSPNYDGLNDALCVLGDRIISMNLEIYNRWGEKVFSSGSQEACWDGTYQGKPQETGNFVYIFDAILDDGEQINESGNLKLIK